MSIEPSYDYLVSVLVNAGYEVDPNSSNVKGNSTRSVYTSFEGPATASMATVDRIDHELTFVVRMLSQDETSPVKSAKQVIGEMYSDIIRLLINEGRFCDQSDGSGNINIKLQEAEVNWKSSQKNMGDAIAVFTVTYREKLQIN